MGAGVGYMSDVAVCVRVYVHVWYPRVCVGDSGRSQLRGVVCERFTSLSWADFAKVVQLWKRMAWAHKASHSSRLQP